MIIVIILLLTGCASPLTREELIQLERERLSEIYQSRQVDVHTTQPHTPAETTAQTEIITEAPPTPPPPTTAIQIIDNRFDDIFSLTISTEHGTLEYGRQFRIHGELKNLTDEDVLIAHITLFGYSIPNWHSRCCGYGCIGIHCEDYPQIAEYDMPLPRFITLEPGGTITTTQLVGRSFHRNHLPIGEHEIRFFARFYLIDGHQEGYGYVGHSERVIIWSNTIMLNAE